MSDKLAALLHEAGAGSVPEKPDDPNARRIEALQKALANTTPDRAGCPWDGEDESERREEPGIWLPTGD